MSFPSYWTLEEKNPTRSEIAQRVWDKRKIKKLLQDGWCLISKYKNSNNKDEIKNKINEILIKLNEYYQYDTLRPIGSIFDECLSLSLQELDGDYKALDFNENDYYMDDYMNLKLKINNEKNDNNIKKKHNLTIDNFCDYYNFD